MAKIVSHDNTKILFGNEDLLLAIQTKSFSQMIFELLSEQTPTSDQLKIFDLILSLSIDHGTDTPSASKTISAAKTGEPISNAVAEGVKEINNTHNDYFTRRHVQCRQDLLGFRASETWLYTHFMR